MATALRCLLVAGVVSLALCPIVMKWSFSVFAISCGSLCVCSLCAIIAGDDIACWLFGISLLSIFACFFGSLCVFFIFCCISCFFAAFIFFLSLFLSDLCVCMFSGVGFVRLRLNSRCCFLIILLSLGEHHCFPCVLGLFSYFSMFSCIVCCMCVNRCSVVVSCLLSCASIFFSASFMVFSVSRLFFSYLRLLSVFLFVRRGLGGVVCMVA